MAAAIDFYFDFVSPYSYLASTVLPRVASGHGVVIDYQPFTLIELMQKVGNRPTTIECQNKGVYVMTDLQRWAKRYQVNVRSESGLAAYRLRGIGALRAGRT